MTYTFKYQTYYGEVNELPLKEFTISGIYLNESEYEDFFSKIKPGFDYELREVIKEA